MNLKSEKNEILEKTLLLPEPTLTSITDINNVLCRLCANPNDRIIGIYSEEGLSNELPNKMNLYLPIKVSENDTLPLQCCWNCASTVLAWHELVVVSVEADRRLRSLLNTEVDKIDNTAVYETFEETVSHLDQEDEERLLEIKPLSTTQDNSSSDKPKKNLILKHCNMSQQQQIAARKARKRRCRLDIEYKIFCDICNTGFTRKLDMKKHRLVQHPNALLQNDAKTETLYAVKEECEAKINVCLVCNAEFKIFGELNKHLKQEHKKHISRTRRPKSEIVAEYFCDICAKGFTRKFDMQKHRKHKHPNEPLQCAEQQKTNTELLKRCKITTDDNQSFYRCEICNSKCRQAYNFIRHQSIHTGIRAYCCHICGKKFRVSSGLHRHISEHHYGVKKYACDICGKTFAAKSTRDDHKNIHTNNRPFVCDLCGKAFRQKASLHTHKLFHTDNYRFSCSICNKKYRRATELKIHMWLHSGHKPYQCSICPSKFRLQHDLTRHKRIHDKGKECICHECGSIFSQERYLKNHKKSHHKND